LTQALSFAKKTENFARILKFDPVILGKIYLQGDCYTASGIHSRTYSRQGLF
jgi:hypothetical protein